MSEVYTWDKVAANNNDAPPDGWPENQAYSSVNNCAREMMAALARDLADRNGTLTSTGTAPAYAVTSNRTIAALTDGLIIGFRAHANSGGGAVTLNLNGLGAQAVENPGPSPFSTFPNITAGDIVLVVWDNAQTRWQLLSALTGGAFGGVTPLGISSTPVAFTAAHVGGPVIYVNANNAIFTFPTGLPRGRIRIANPNRYNYVINNLSAVDITRTDDVVTIVPDPGTPYGFVTTNVGATLLIETASAVYVDTLL